MTLDPIRRRCAECGRVWLPMTPRDPCPGCGRVSRLVLGLDTLPVAMDAEPAQEPLWTGQQVDLPMA